MQWRISFFIYFFSEAGSQMKALEMVSNLGVLVGGRGTWVTFDGINTNNMKLLVGFLQQNFARNVHYRIKK